MKEKWADNWILKLIALALAFVTWFYVHGEIGK